MPSWSSPSTRARPFEQRPHRYPRPENSPCPPATNSGPHLKIRPLNAGDVPAVAQLSADAFEFQILDERTESQWRERFAHLLSSDPGGSWVAVQDGRPIGVAQAMIREGLWVLSLLTVAPEEQSGGAGRLLLERALAYGGEERTGLIVSSNDPRAIRLYGRSGFTLLPTFESTGHVARGTLQPSDPEIREVGGQGLELAAEISRQVRGAPHTAELELVLGQGARLIVHGSRGFLVSRPGHAVWLLAASEELAARALLWRALADLPDGEPANLRWVTEAQTWAIEVMVAAGLGVRAFGALAVRGRPGPLHPFLPSPPFA